MSCSCQKPDLLIVPYGRAAKPEQWPDHGKELSTWVTHTARRAGCAVVGIDVVGEITHGPWTGYPYGGQSVVCDRDGKALILLADRQSEVKVVEVRPGRAPCSGTDEARFSREAAKRGFVSPGERRGTRRGEEQGQGALPPVQSQHAPVPLEPPRLAIVLRRGNGGGCAHCGPPARVSAPAFGKLLPGTTLMALHGGLEPFWLGG